MLFSTLTVWAQSAPVFTSSPPSSPGVYQATFTYNITSTDPDGDATEILLSNGVLPDGLSFTDNGDGTAIITGTAAHAGVFNSELTVRKSSDHSFKDVQAVAIEISKATITIALSDLSQVYTGLPLKPTATTTPAVGIDFTYNSASGAPTMSGSYTLAATVVDDNYMGSASGTFVINKAPLTAKAQNASRLYGQANPAFAINYTGFVNGETVTAITPPIAGTSAGPNSPATTYPITLTGGNADNYNITLQDGTLTVGQATLTAKANDNTKTYGQANPAFSIAYSGFVNGETVTAITPPVASSIADNTSVVGSYPITVAGGAAANYTFAYQSGSLAVTPAPLVAKADNQARVYGQANPSPFTISYTGFVNSDNVSSITVPTATTTGAIGSPVGTYPIMVSGGLATNYAFTYQSGTLTITPAMLTAKADNHSRIYGQSNPAPFTISYTGFVNGDNATTIVPPTAGSTATELTGVGTYPITVSGGVASNYNFSYQNGTLTIGQATLTARADDKTRVYGQANPLPFTISYSGFVNGDNVAAITPPMTGTTAALSSPVGNYPITLTGGTSSNYALVLQSGNLSVTKATPVITWPTPAAINYGTALSATQLNATANVPGVFNYTPSIGTTLNAGAGQVLAVSFTPTDAADYNSVGSTTVLITVNKATPVITWANPAPIVYGTALTATQLNAAANVLGTFVYTPAIGAVLGASASQTLTANFTPDDAANYNSVVGATSHITITKANPVITWNNPAQITYGTPLSAVQLNATANVPGTFSYAPGAGTILSTGSNQALSVNFTPTDAANYNSVNGTQVLITVVKATLVISWANPADITYGTALSGAQLNATTTTPGTFTYSPIAGTILDAGVGQILSVSFTPTDGANFNPVAATQVTINVNKATPAITWPTPAAITYGTPLSATQLNATSPVAGTFTYNPAIGTVLSAGTNQILTANFMPTSTTNYNVVNGAQVLLTVNKAVPVITWATPAAISYGTPLSAVQLSATANVPGTFTYSPDVGALMNAGANQTLSATFTPTDNNNYSIVTGITRQISVTKANPVITWATPLPIKVGVALSSTQLNATANVPGTFTYSPPAGTVLSAGNNQILSVNFVPTDGANYNTINNTQVLITVSVKDNPIITWTAPAPITYGTALTVAQLNATANVPGTFTYTPALGTILNAGVNQNLSANFVPTDGVNYNAVNTNVSITVNKAILTTTATNASRVYGAPNPAYTITYAGFVNGDTQAVIDTPPIATSNATVSSAAGTSYPIIPAGGADNNYSFNYVNGTLSISKATLTVRADDKSRSYGLANPAFTITYTGFVNGDTEASISPASASTTASQSSNVGTYPITPVGGAAANYNFVYQDGTLTINIVPLTATADNKSKNYGQVNPTFTITYNGFLNGDNTSSITQPTISTTATVLSGVGTYVIKLTGGSALNYGLILQNGTLTVGPAQLTAKADDKTKVYGQANPSNSITYTGFINGDNATSITPPTLTGPAASTGSGVGVYPISLSGGAATNYNLNLQNGALTITPAPLRVVVQNATRGYGLSNPPFTFNYNNADFVNGDNAASITAPALSTTATTASNVGTYPITASGTAQNYNFVVTNGTLTITPAVLTATANNASKTYGDPNPALTVSYSGFVNGDATASITTLPVASTTATTGSAAGNYPINVSGGAATNYNFSYSPGTLTINKATLNVTANNQSRFYGIANPPLTITYVSFVNGDTKSDLDIQPVAVTAATTTSQVGVYPITLTPGQDNNYNFNYFNGTLSIITGTAPVIKDFLILDNEDTRYNFTYENFNANFISSPGDSILSIKIVSPPSNGSLFWDNKKLLAGDEVAVKKGVITGLYYQPNADFSGNDTFGYNVFDGAFTAAQNAVVTIKLAPVNDPPVISNIEVAPLLYELGDPGVIVSTTLILSDVDNNFLFGATASVSENFNAGDELSLGLDVSADIVPTFDGATGVLSLTGKATKSNYEAALHSISFSSPIGSSTSLTDKKVSFTVRDSSSNSNIVSRVVKITKVFPELSIVSAFTPNNDGVNDYWDFVNLDFYNVINIAVFDRNGTRVFDCDAADCKWDGKVKGKDLPFGPYFYSIDLDNGKRKYIGTVTILK